MDESWPEHVKQHYKARMVELESLEESPTLDMLRVAIVQICVEKTQRFYLEEARVKVRERAERAEKTIRKMRKLTQPYK
jgi:hypothetical protein